MHLQTAGPSLFTLLSLLASFVHSLPATIGTRQSRSARNDIKDGGCKPFTLIFARGTTEGGNLGTVVGPPLVSALSAALPGGRDALAVQGVDYPANVAGFAAGGDRAGSQEMADLVASACEDTTVIMSGYSQGAQLVHNAIALMPQDTAKKVGAVVMFGDPKNGNPLGKGLDDIATTFCNRGDLICAGRAIILAPHLTYGADARDAAAFVVDTV